MNPPQRASADAEVAGVVITQPDKILWPATGSSQAVTKRDLALYYHAAAGRILPHIAKRPLSIVRAPDGIAGKTFFQRHAGAAHLPSMAVAGEDQPFVAIETEAQLVGLAQVGVLEFHPWGAAPSKPDIPERLIFDLDPADDVAFAKVMTAAKEIAARLETCGLVGFLKTTGGKGLHVVTPVKGTSRNPVTWENCKDFAKAICQMMQADSPQLYTIKAAKTARSGKIFIDYLRNDRSATAVAPWSPRARPGAPLSVPIVWAQLGETFDPHAFVLADMDAILRKSDPWQNFWDAAKPLAAARRKRAAP
jgi:bifunctional non-homologous end joining protein LigD